MKKYAMLALATVFMFSVTLMAQEQTPQAGRKGHKKEMRQGMGEKMNAQQRAEHMAKAVGLTDAEKVKVQALFEKQDAKRLQQRAEMQKVRQAQMAKFDNDKKAQDTELEKIIGKEKFQKHESIRANRQEKMKQRREGANPNDSTCCAGKGHRNGQKMSKGCPKK